MGSVAQTGLLLVPSDALPRPHLGLTWGPRGRAGFALRNWHGDAIDWTEGDALDASKDASKGCGARAVLAFHTKASRVTRLLCVHHGSMGFALVATALIPAVAALSVQAPARRRLDVTCPGD